MNRNFPVPSDMEKFQFCYCAKKKFPITKNYVLQHLIKKPLHSAQSLLPREEPPPPPPPHPRTYLFEAVLVATGGGGAAAAGFSGGNRRGSLLGGGGGGGGSSATTVWGSAQFWEDVFCGEGITPSNNLIDMLS